MYLLLKILIFCGVFLSFAYCQFENDEFIDDVSQILREKRDYNKHNYPLYDQNKPTNVTIQMYVEGMSSFRAQSMDFQLDIYFQEMWHDPRLAHNKSRRLLVKDPKIFARLWHPDLYFANARTASFHDVTEPNFLVWIYENGTVWYDCRISLTVLCMQDLSRYPLDAQNCGLRILSYAYGVDELVIVWSANKPVDVNTNIRMPDMEMVNNKCSTKNEPYATGVWSTAIVEFHVKRQITHHIIQSYIPTSLIVIISWFSFWLDVEAVPGRVSLSITTLLTLATQSSAAKMALPQTSDVKAIDVWMGTCMAFVFSAMIEFTAVNYCVRRKPRMKPRSKSLSEQVQDLVSQYKEKKADFFSNGSSYEITMQPAGASTEEDTKAQRNFEKKELREMNQAPLFVRRQFLPTSKRKTIEERINRVEENRKYAQSIDRWSRILFPITFLIFNAIYWFCYLYLYNEGIPKPSFT